MDFVAKEIHYHNIHQVRYQKKATFTIQGYEEVQFQCDKTEKHDKSDQHISHNAHQHAFETLMQ